MTPYVAVEVRLSHVNETPEEARAAVEAAVRKVWPGVCWDEPSVDEVELIEWVEP
jgi:hypothetical protein